MNSQYSNIQQVYKIHVFYNCNSFLWESSDEHVLLFGTYKYLGKILCNLYSIKYNFPPELCISRACLKSRLSD